MPCEVLIKLNRGSYSAPDKDDWVWKKGFPVVVRDYPNVGWGTDEDMRKNPNADFVIAYLPNLAASDVQRFLDAHMGTVVGTYGGGTWGTYIVPMGRREYEFTGNIVDNILGEGGYATFNVGTTQLNNYMRKRY